MDTVTIAAFGTTFDLKKEVVQEVCTEISQLVERGETPVGVITTLARDKGYSAALATALLAHWQSEQVH